MSEVEDFGHDDCEVCNESRDIANAIAALERLEKVGRLNDFAFSLPTQLWFRLSDSLANASIKY